MESIFDAFFWIEPTPSSAEYDSTRVIWHYPDDVKEVAKEFRDIPQFCFPDIEKTTIEKCESTNVEYFVFTMTNKEGKRSFGVCLRGLFRGEKRRYDVKRRRKHCICFITKYPYFTIFKTLLSQIFAVTLLEPSPTAAHKILDHVYKLSQESKFRVSEIIINMNKINYASNYGFNTIPNDFIIQLPTGLNSHFGYRNDVSLLPLLEILGVEKFLLVLNATLNEQRIIFIANEVETLSSSLLAVSSMIYPFSWQYLFLPLLPTKLITYASAPYPYLIGIRRYQLPTLYKQELGDVILVDLDSGECSTKGNVVVKDIIGDSGNVMKQASETIDMITRSAGGFASKLMKSANLASLLPTNETSSGTSSLSKDVVACIINDLRNYLASKPGNISLQAMTSGLLRGIPGVSKTSAEAAKIQWMLDDIDEAINTNYLLQHSKTSSKLTKTDGQNSRNIKSNISEIFNFDIFLKKKQQTGNETREVLIFLNDFLQTQMLLTFCDHRYIKLTTAEPDDMDNMNNVNDENLFDVICNELKNKGMLTTISNIKSVIANIRNYQEQLQNFDNNSSLDSQSKLKGLNLHSLTIQMTGGLVSSSSLSQSDSYIVNRRDSVDTSSANATDSPAGSTKSPFFSGESRSQNIPARVTVYDNPQDVAITKICQDSYNTSLFPKIMKTISIRLSCCRASGGRGTAGLAGKRALILLKSLLVDGAECVLTASFDLIPIIRDLIHLYGKVNDVSVSQSSAFEMISLSTNYSGEILPYAKYALRLMLDHNMLQLQRTYSLLSKSGVFYYDQVNRFLTPDPYKILDTGRYPSFVAVHNRCRPPTQCNLAPELSKYNLKLTRPTKMGEEDRNDEEGEIDEDNGTNITSNNAPIPIQPTYINPPPAKPNRPREGSERTTKLSHDLISFSDPVVIVPTKPASITSSSAQINGKTNVQTYDLFPSSQQSHNSGSSSETSSTSFTEDMKYRIVNKDTGEVFDIRYDIDKTLPKNDKVLTPQNLPPALTYKPQRSPVQLYDPIINPVVASFTPSKPGTNINIQNTTTGFQASVSSSQPQQQIRTNNTLLRPMPKPSTQSTNNTNTMSSNAFLPSTGQSQTAQLNSKVGQFTQLSQALATQSGPNKPITSLSSQGNIGQARDAKPKPRDPFSDLIDIKKLS